MCGLAAQWTQLVAHAMIGGGLLLLALILLLAVPVGRPPRLSARPPLQAARPAATLGILVSATRAGDVSRSAQEGLNLASKTVSERSRSSLLGMLALATVIGFIISRER